MDLKQLRHFVAIVDHGTFLAAAKAIPLSQPALSRSLQNLEAYLGTMLLNRSTRGIQITEAGERLYRRAKLIISQADKAVMEAQMTAPAASLSIGVAPMFAGELLPQAIRAISRTNPDLNLTVASGLFPDLIKTLSSGGIDILVSNLPFTEIPDDLTVEPLLDITVSYVASISHPLAKLKVCDFSNLSEYPWAVMNERHANDLYRYIFTSEGETRSPIMLKTNSLTLLKSVISEPPYISLLPYHMIQQDVAEQILAVLNVNQDQLKRKGGLVYRKNDVPNAALDAFKDALRSLLA